MGKLEELRGAISKIKPQTKSGVLVNVGYGVHTVTFNEPFSKKPTVVVSFASPKMEGDLLMVQSVSMTDFKVVYRKVGSSNNEKADLAWIATDAGG